MRSAGSFRMTAEKQGSGSAAATSNQRSNRFASPAASSPFAVNFRLASSVQAEPVKSMAAALHRDRQVKRLRVTDRGDDVRFGAAAGDPCRLEPDHRVEGPPRLLVAGVAGLEIARRHGFPPPGRQCRHRQAQESAARKVHHAGIYPRPVGKTSLPAPGGRSKARWPQRYPVRSSD
jgi:hypothetical protein